MMSRQQRAQGVMVGLGLGDAMGAPVELWTREQILQSYGGELQEVTGTTTDDTAQALALSDAIDPHYEPTAAIANYVSWYINDGSGIGSNSRYVLSAAAAGEDSVIAAQEFLELRPERPPSNGALMRCAPLAIRYVDDEATMIKAARADAALTHAHPLCAESSVWFLRILRAMVADEWDGVYIGMIPDEDTDDAAWERIEQYASFSMEQASDWAGRGRGATTVPVGLIAQVLQSDWTAREAMIWAVNLGGDTDTNAALVGALVGARDGIDAFPALWRNGLYSEYKLIDEADRLVSLW